MKPPPWKEEWSEPPDVGAQDNGYDDEREPELEVEVAVEASDEEGVPEDDLCDADTTPVPRRDA